MTAEERAELLCQCLDGLILKAYGTSSETFHIRNVPTDYSGVLWFREYLAKAIADAEHAVVERALVPKPSGPCQHGDCDSRPATDYAQGRNDKRRLVKAYCEDHARSVADEGDPEYMECCPCCGCYFGVN